MEKPSTPNRNLSSSQLGSATRIIRDIRITSKLHKSPEDKKIFIRNPSLPNNLTIKTQQLTMNRKSVDSIRPPTRLASSTKLASESPPKTKTQVTKVNGSAKELINFIRYQHSTPTQSNNETKVLKPRLPNLDLKQDKPIPNLKSSTPITLNLERKPSLFEFSVPDSVPLSLRKSKQAKSRPISRDKLTSTYLVKSMPDIVMPISLPRTVQKYAFLTKTGMINGKHKKNNQDALSIISNFADTKNQWFFAVCDGHGLYGHEISNYIQKMLPMFISHYIPANRILQTVRNKINLTLEDTHKIKKAIQDGFYRVNSELFNPDRGFNITYSGSTTVSIVIRGNWLVCSNVGDSRAVLGRKSGNTWQAVAISRDQKPDNPVERQRIEARGGRVEAFKGKRIYRP
jgi:hypothetical protein